MAIFELASPKMGHFYGHLGGFGGDPLETPKMALEPLLGLFGSKMGHFWGFLGAPKMTPFLGVEPLLGRFWAKMGHFLDWRILPPFYQDFG